MTRIKLVVLSTIFILTFSAMMSSVAFAQSGASNQDKAQACKELADKRNLTGNDRKTFLQSCMSKAAGTSQTNNQQGKPQQAANDKLNEMSQKDKLNACDNLADKRNLKGADRRSFLKDCMQKANPK